AASTKIRSSFAACFALLLGTVAAFAHNSTAQYDMTNPLTVKGEVERLEWTSPHALLYVNVKNDKGSLEEWTIVIDSPNFLKQKGWTSNTVKPGDMIACTGGRAKSGARTMR